MNEDGLHGSETTVVVYQATERHTTEILMRDIGDEALRSREDRRMQLIGQRLHKEP